MSPAGKMGRPPSKDPRQSKVTAKLTDSEIKKLDYCCEVMGVTRSDVLRLGLVEVYSKLPPMHDEK